MRALWYALYWPAMVMVVLCLIVNFLTTFLHSLAQEAAEYAEKKLRAHRGRA